MTHTHLIVKIKGEIKGMCVWFRSVSSLGPSGGKRNQPTVCNSYGFNLSHSNWLYLVVSCDWKTDFFFNTNNNFSVPVSHPLTMTEIMGKLIKATTAQSPCYL